MCGKFFQNAFAFAHYLRLYSCNGFVRRPFWSPIMTSAQAIAIENTTARNLKVLGMGLFSSAVVISIVSLIGGVLRPLMEW